MPIPFLLMAAAGAVGAIGAKKGITGAMDSSRAGEIQREAQQILNEAKGKLEKVKENTTYCIENLGKTKLQVSAEEINAFVTYFSKIKNVSLKDSVGLDELKKLNITKENLQEMRETSLKATDVLSGGIAGVGAGALLGWGTYGGVMALGTATTGTAIGTLSGAAATNATLAWLGGGSLAAGGGGMALGSAVLGGIIAGPALLVAGGIFGAKAKEKLNNAYSNLAEAKKIQSEMESAETELKIIGKNARQMNSIIKGAAQLLKQANENLSKVIQKSVDWKLYDASEKEKVIAAMKSAQLVKGLIDMPLLTEDGILTEDIRNAVNDRELRSMTGVN